MKHLLIALLCLAGPFAAAGETSLNQALHEHGLEVAGGESIAVSSDVRRPGQTKKFRSIVAAQGELRLELEIIEPMTPSQAAQYSKSRYQLVRASYTNAPTPYQGEVTRLDQCPKQYLPKETKVPLFGASVPVIEGYANDRYVFGACTPELARQKGWFAIAYQAKANRLVQLRAFQPAGAADGKAAALLKSLRATSPLQ